MNSRREDMDLDETSLSLLDLPIELDYAIANHVPYNEETKTMAALATTCKQFGDHQLGFFGQELEKRASNQLGKYIEDANIVKVEAMIKANPRLLLRPIKEIMNPHTQQIIVGMTPLQAARCEGDDEMCLMLIKYFKMACGNEEAGLEEINKQLNEKFGEGSDEHKDSKVDRKNRLTAVIQAITNERFTKGHNAATNKWILSEATHLAIATFRKEFAESQPKIIHSGMRFHLEILQEIFEAYAQAAKQWSYDYKKCSLFEDAVLSTVLRYAAANDIQRFSQGLYYLQDQRNEFKRRFTTRDGHNFYQLLHGKSLDFPISGSCVDIASGERLPPWYTASRIDTVAACLQDLRQAKTSNLESLCSHAHERKRLGA